MYPLSGRSELSRSHCKTIGNGRSHGGHAGEYFQLQSTLGHNNLNSSLVQNTLILSPSTESHSLMAFAQSPGSCHGSEAQVQVQLLECVSSGTSP